MNFIVSLNKAFLKLAGSQLLSALCHCPGEPIAVRSGYDSRGVNSIMTLEVSGQVTPTTSTTTQTTSSISSFVVCETTAELKVGLGKSVAIHF